jgi:uncharacterized protein YbjT (DUF2867 family)
MDDRGTFVRLGRSDGRGMEAKVDRSDRIVVVTGATGRQGGAVATHLLSDGWRVRALTRRPELPAARRLAALGAEVVRVDLADSRSLGPAFGDAYGVFSVQNPMTGGIESEIAQGKNVADAAKAVGVSHVVYGSAGIGAAGTGIGSWESKLTVQAHMEALGLPLTVLRPMAFMELMTDRGLYPPVAVWHLMPRFAGEDLPIGWICVDDIGAIAARAFAEPGHFIGADIRLAADVQSIAECRRIWRSVVGRSPARFRMPVWMFKRFVGSDLITMWSWLRTAGLQFDLGPTRGILPGARTVGQWLTGRRDQPNKAGHSRAAG